MNLGADLYIKKMPREKQYTGWRTKISVGYFRDAYNETNLLWKLELSYWRLADKWAPNGEMPVENIKKLLRLVKRRRGLLEANIADYPENWQRYFRRKYDLFIRFLKKAIKLNSPIIWDV